MTHDPMEDVLRRALSEAADIVTTSGDGLERIRERTARTIWWRRPGVLVPAMAGLAAAAAVVAVVSWPSSSDPNGAVVGTPTTPSPTTTTEPSPAPSPPTPSPNPSAVEPSTPATGGSRVVPVYYVSETGRGVRLAREFRATTSPSSDAEAAVEIMLEGPADPDYSSLWGSDVTVRSVDVEPDLVTVDLSGASLAARLGSADDAHLAMQQLVFTVQAVAQDRAPVRVLVDGGPAETLWQQVDVAQPVRNDEPMDVRMLVQLNSPGEGGRSGRQVRVTGEAAAFEANLLWRVTRAGSGEEVDSGFTMTTNGQVLAPFAFELELDPGEYVLEVTEDDPSGGEGYPPTTDTKQFTVVG